MNNQRRVITPEGKEILFLLKKSKRSTMAITIETDGSVIVKMPNQISEQEVISWVKEKADWIFTKQQEMLEQYVHIPKRQFEEGALFSYLGMSYSLHMVQEFQPEQNRLPWRKAGKLGSVALSENTIYVWLSSFQKTAKRMSFHQGKPVAVVERESADDTAYQTQKEIKACMEQWYIMQAREYFGERVKYYAEKMNETVHEIHIKNQKSRWGSCSSLGNLNFNWRIIMAPPEIVDYIVVHELCHLKIMNHSPAFWAEVKKVLPDYVNREQWLKHHGRELEW